MELRWLVIYSVVTGNGDDSVATGQFAVQNKEMGELAGKELESRFTDEGKHYVYWAVVRTAHKTEEPVPEPVPVTDAA